ncbi:MAG: hypothetical protein O7B99_09105 [Planctomycetota bacterium]|nr:hypothetical protein [Planctomycetota bacterium]
MVVAVLAHAPCLGFGFHADDYGHQLVLRGLVDHPTIQPWNLYDFGGLPGPGDESWEAGSFPWWTSPDWNVRFFRPLTSLSLWLDHAVYGNQAAGYHASGLLYFALLLAIALALYRRLGLPSRAVLLALLVLGLEDGGVIPVGWLANRNSLLEVLFQITALLVLVRGGPLPVALLLAFGASLAKESGVVTFAVLALYLMVAPGIGPTRRRVGIAACFGIAAAWVAWLVASGYGASCLFYPTPWDEPGAFLGRLAVLLPIGPVSLSSPLPSDILFLRPSWAAPAAIACLLLAAPVTAIVLRTVRSHPAVVFLGGWLLLTLIPQAGAPISDRLLLGPAVPFAALLGLFLDRALTPEFWVPKHVRTLALVLLVSAIPLSGLSLVARGVQMAKLATLSRDTVVQADVGPPELGAREVFWLQSPSELPALVPISAWSIETGDLGVRHWVMQMGRRGVRWSRVDAHTFELESLDSPFASGPLERVFLSHSDEFTVGQRWSTALFEVEAIAVEPDGVRTIRVTCPDDLEDPRYRFLTWRDDRLRRIDPPAVGETLTLETVPAPIPFVP